MIRIALVEDDEKYREQLQEYIARYAAQSGEKITVAGFTDGDEIALGYKARYDIILMDIEMKFMDGMTAAEEIRKIDSAVVIIFITNSPQYAIKGYAVDALDYVLKPLSYFAFSQRLDRAIARMKNRSRKYLTVAVRGGAGKLDAARIYYVETQGHNLIFHTADGIVEATGSLREVEEELSGCGFFRCNKGYLVNLEHVDRVQDDAAIVHGEAVQLSRARKKAFLDALNTYINEAGK